MDLSIGPTYVEINLDIIGKNVRSIKKLIRDKKLLAVVKGDAYTHGIVEVSQTALENGASYLGVGRLEEGIFLRMAGIKAPILNMCLNMKGQERELIEYGITQTVCDLDSVKRISDEAAKINKIAKLHLKVDTGMGRIGVFPEEAVDFVAKVDEMKNVELEGIFTHFATPHDLEFMKYQLSLFIKVLNDIDTSGYHIPIKHCASSAAITALPETYKKFDMVRPGDLIYGVYNSEEDKKVIDIKFAQNFKTHIIFLKKVGPGVSIGYDRTYTTNKTTIVATLAAGYNDGYTKLYSNRGIVLVRGMKAPVIGRVCADQTMIDVTDIPNVNVGDEAILWGRQKDKIIMPVYDFLLMSDKSRVPKIFIKNDRIWKIKSMFGEKFFQA
ncbi:MULTISPECIES: alanine racemase [Tepidanaerobacter]|uniref:alanine racemase n=1 Tax=Tepidanaerobacter TaxID=499228 RepID=UPI000A9A3AE5|nr:MULTISPECIES: alanine racemase [Tepidanaerobacter]